MKEHFCPAEQSTITYQGKCNWCGESEGSMTQEILKLAEDYAKNRANYHIESLYGTSESYTATIKKAMLEAHQALKETLAQTQELKIGCVNHDCEKCKAQKACVYCGQLVAKEKNNGV